MTSIQLQNIGKDFSATTALADISLSVAAGELLFLLGPSGCGKSTLLRIVAGLLEPTTGKILFDGRDVTHLKTEQRSAVMCFQNYALWPHMTVLQNVEFGLTMQGGSEKRSRAMEVLRLVQLENYVDRKPGAMSGGQQQRAALARALAVKPRALLLDEPLSNLDAKLRNEMRSEIRRICKSGGYTTLYVTHDQKEALSIADRIVLLNAGRIAQIGTPAELYYRPATSFVAGFVGQTNLLKGKAHASLIETAIGQIRTAGNGWPHGKEIIVSIRPEKIRLASVHAPQSSDANRFPGKIVETTFLGESSEHLLEVAGQKLRATSSPPVLEASGDVTLEIDPADCTVLPE